MIKEKRNDLQCWRAFSIFAVLLFHIWPKITPNGFLGVDIFFILSGFFMAKHYFNRKTSNISYYSYFGEFYFKRIKRITPVYFVIAICLICFLSYSIQDIDYLLATADFKWASLFLTNFQDRLTNLDYFSVKSQFHFFRHCWSLSVEMQFYYIFPFIALIQTKFRHNLFRTFLVLLLLASLIYQQTRGNAIDHYENTISRMWQFIVGIIAAQKTAEAHKYLCKFLFIIVSVLVFCPIPLSLDLASFSSVTMVAIIITLSSSKYSPFDHLPFYSSVVYIGDISYTLYLVHWPLITYMKYCTINEALNFFEGFIACLSSVMLAIILHETIEKPLMKHCKNLQRLIWFLLLSYSFAFVFIQPPIATRQIVISKVTQKFIADVNNFTKPMKLSLEWTRQNDIEFANYIKKSHTFVGNITKCDIEKNYFVDVGGIYTHYCEVESNLKGNLTSMIIGNSYAHNVLPVISSNKYLRKVISMTAFGCLYVEKPPGKCAAYVNAVKEAVISIKPDIIFFIQGYVTLSSSIEKKSVQDQWTRNFNYAFNFFSMHSSVIISNHQHFRFKKPVNAEFLRRKNFGYDIDMTEKKLPGLTTLDKIQLFVPCSKCLWINYNDFFCQNDYCIPIDPITKLPMFLDEDHITIIGARRVQKIYEDTIYKALTLIKSQF